MPYVIGNIPFFECFIRAEYTRNLEDRHGEFYPAVAHAVRSVRGQSLQFQVTFTDRHAGASFLLPIEALVWKPCDKQMDMTYVQPWDCMSSEFGVCELEFMKRGAVDVLPGRFPGQYRFTIDWTGTDLADMFEQHKAGHLVFIEGGLIGMFPNNRVLWHDPAFWVTTTERPDFKSLSGEFRAEGNQQLFRRELSAPSPTLADSAQTDFFANGNGRSHDNHGDTRFWSSPI